MKFTTLLKEKRSPGLKTKAKQNRTQSLEHYNEKFPLETLEKANLSTLAKLYQEFVLYF